MDARLGELLKVGNHLRLLTLSMEEMEGELGNLFHMPPFPLFSWSIDEMETELGVLVSGDGILQFLSLFSSIDDTDGDMGSLPDLRLLPPLFLPEFSLMDASDTELGVLLLLLSRIILPKLPTIDGTHKFNILKAAN